MTSAILSDKSSCVKHFTDITQEMLHDSVNYDLKTGVFTWKNRPLLHFSGSHESCSIFNKKYAGKEVGGKQGMFIGLHGVRIRKAYRTTSQSH